MNDRGTLLVTGGLGYVGARLLPEVLKRGWSVRVLDLALYGEGALRHLEAQPEWEDWQHRFTLVRGDTRDPSTVREALSGVTSVVHLAAVSNDPTGEVDTVLTRQVNFDAVGLLLAIAKECGVHRFINASSSSVFGIKQEAEIVESLEPEPISAYSRNKMLAEWLVVTASSPELCAVNVRPATVCGYSPRQRFDLTVNKLTADAVRKRVITVHGGQQRRPNVWIGDMVELYCQLLDSEAATINGRTFNFGFENHPVLEIAKIVQSETTDLDVKIEVTEVHDRRDYHISSTKLTRELGYQPIGSIRHAVRELRAHLEGDEFQDIDDPLYHNMKSMQLSRCAEPYAYLAR